MGCRLAMLRRSWPAHPMRSSAARFSPLLTLVVSSASSAWQLISVGYVAEALSGARLSVR